MNTALLAKARRLWALPDVPASTVRHNMRTWARAVARLGDRWLLAKRIERKTDAV